MSSSSVGSSSIASRHSTHSSNKPDRENALPRENNNYSILARAEQTENSDDAFGEFPPHMMQQTSAGGETCSHSEMQQKTTRFALDDEDTTNRETLANLGSTKKVLVLESSENKNSTKNRGEREIPTTMPNGNPESSYLDFSMIATPGGGKMARIVNDEGGDTASLKSEGTSSVASSGRWATGTPFTSLLRGVISSTPSVHPRKFSSSTPYTAARQSFSKNEEKQSTKVDEDAVECTALMFARSAPLSGYLRKLGKNVPKFKRRFFVLKPSTHLYYFMSPNDVEPRGCIDLDLMRERGEGGGCEVREIGLLPDGTFRFELLFDEEIDDDELNTSYGTYDDVSDTGSRTSYSSNRREFQRQSIVLEARTEEIGREWMSKLQTERLSTARDQIDFLRTTLAEVKATSSRWERSAYEEALRAEEAEKSRDIAISEAKAWESKFRDLNEAIKLLANLDEITKAESTGNAAESSVFHSDNSHILHGLDIGDTHILNAFKAFENVQRKHSQAVESAEKAKRHILELEQRAEDAESRLSKAEAELCKVWEDNCSIQKDLKKVRREKKILVKEVRSLHAEKKTNEINEFLPPAQDRSAISENCNSSLNSRANSKCDEPNHTCTIPRQRKLLEEERRLVIELEEHVMSGLRLSEQFLTLNGIEPSVVDDDYDSIFQSSKTSINRTPERRLDQNLSLLTSDIPVAPTEEVVSEKTQPAGPCESAEQQIMGSLLDDTSIQNDESDDEDNGGKKSENVSQITSLVNPPGSKSDGKNDFENTIHHSDEHFAISCENNELQNERPIKQNLYHRFSEICKDNRSMNHENNCCDSTTSTCSSVSQQLQLQKAEQKPPHDVASSVSESSRSLVTDNGQATTKLECTLKDVGQSPHSRPRSTLGEDGRVYHITFYSSKIGLQFQKVPNEFASGGGLLTEAMTIDHGPYAAGNPTASEIRRIAGISQRSKKCGKNGNDHEVECPPVIPDDAVLVCGFLGFDESTGNVRPRIGARLVAFDGIPVEVGKWTFESIRKSIQARGRPLTLSFRNDFLTPKQREILTKAVEDVNPSAPPFLYQPISYNNSAKNAIKHRNNSNDNENESTTSTSSTSSRNQIQRQRNKYYSFSEAGSSITSAVAPLMSNLMTGLSSGKSGKPRHEPDYLRRQSDSLEKMRHYHDFKAGLL
ncbi:hypothetical protein ACHAXS_010884 [Conticribra weissflogii]